MNHLAARVVALSHYPSAQRASSLSERSGLRHSEAGSPDTPSRIEFLAYGLVTHLVLLSTLSFDDAVAFGYGPESVCPERTFTSLTPCTCRRTSACASRRPGPCVGHGPCSAVLPAPPISPFSLSPALAVGKGRARRPGLAPPGVARLGTSDKPAYRTWPSSTGLAIFDCYSPRKCKPQR